MANENEYNYRRQNTSAGTGSRPGTHRSALEQERGGTASTRTAGAARPASASEKRAGGTAQTGAARTQTGTTRTQNVAAESSAARAAAARKAEQEKKRKMQRKYLIRRVVVGIIVLAVLALLVFGVVKLAKRVFTPKPVVKSPVVKEIVWEAGSGFPAAELFLSDTGKAEKENGAQIAVETDMSQLNFNVQGAYRVMLRYTGVDGEETQYTATIRVVDTIPPQGVAASNLWTYVGEPRPVADYIESVNDATDVAVSLVREPDYDTPGIQTVELLLEDRGGNQTRLTAQITVLEKPAE
ncbi:MAG: hypothetical protein II789_03030 [Clostridia bacterium]|nr:hypothetical protein [Clostridia bacterium]